MTTLSAEQGYEEAKRRIEKARKERLGMFDLSGLGLEVLPPEIAELKWVSMLLLNDNKLAELPAEIGGMTRLMELDCSCNQLKCLPKEITSLKSLSWIFLDRNDFDRFPILLAELPDLTVLRMEDNRLSSIEPGLGNATNLIYLGLAGNPLTSLPPDLQRHPALETLYLHRTPIADQMPDSILGHSEEQVNEHKLPPPNARAILDYYFSNLRESRQLNEARVLVVGRGAAGKTSLCRAVMGKAFDPNQSETQGVEIQIGALKVACEGPEAREITLHFWDFAGQEITYALHRFFLSSGAIYLLALDNRSDMALADAEDWLRSIHAYSQDNQGHGLGADVVVALTKQDTKRWELEEEELRERWGRRLRSLTFVNTDAKTRRGVDELKQILTRLAAGMPEVAKGFPVEYQAAKRHFQNMRQRGEKLLGLPEFRTICRENGIQDSVDESGQLQISAADRADGLAGILHSLGVVLHYAGDARLRDNTVLDPQWVTNGVYTLLRGLEQEGQPSLTLTKARKLLPEDDLPGVRYLLNLMEQFEMIYRVDTPDSEGDALDPRTTWLMPAILPVNQPKMREDHPWRQPDPEEIKIRHTYSLLPEGLLPRLIVRTWPLNEEMDRWRSGTFLREGYATALARAVKRERTVEITVRGPQADRERLARLISRHMEAIHADAPEPPKTEILVRVTVNGRVEEAWKNVAVLAKDEARTEGGQSSVDTSEGSTPVAATQVLDNISGKAKRDWEKEERTYPHLARILPGMPGSENRPVKVFVSYAHKDKKVCDVFLQNLAVMEQEGLVDAWVDHMVPSGEEWHAEIQWRLEEADLFIALVTTPFLASKYISNKERPRAMERHRKGSLELAWVIVEDCGWRTQDFAKLQTIRPGGRAARQWSRLQDAFNAVEPKIREMLKEMRAKRAAKSQAR